MRMSFVGLLPLVLVSISAAAQETEIPACQSQQDLEQVMGSDGQIMPDGCRTLRVSVLESNGQKLCLLDFSSEDGGIVGELREAALPERWWVRCEEFQQLSE